MCEAKVSWFLCIGRLVLVKQVSLAYVFMTKAFLIASFNRQEIICGAMKRYG